MNTKKTISPVVATALLLVVAVVAVVGFQGWFSTYSSGVFTDTEIKSDSGSSIVIDTLIGNTLYILSDSLGNISINSLTIDGNKCTINKNLTQGMNQLNVTSCLDNLSTVTPDAVLITDNKIVEKKLYLKTVNVESQISQVLSLVNYNSTLAQWIGGSVASGQDFIFSVFVDDSGNIYVGGNMASDITDDGLLSFNGVYSGGTTEGFVAKFDSSGNHLWGQWIGGVNSDTVRSVFGDNSGNIYVGGAAANDVVNDGLSFNGVHSSSGGYEAFIAKFNSSGNHLWGQWLGGLSGETVYSISVDSSDNVYIGGYSNSDITDDGLLPFNGTRSLNAEGFVAKFDSSGNHLWGQWLGDSLSDYVYSVSVDSSDNVYVGGFMTNGFSDDDLSSFSGNYSGNREAFVAKFSSSGNHLWGQWLGGASLDSVGSVFVDSSDNVYIGGYSRTDIVDDGLLAFDGNFTDSGLNEAFIAKFSSSGNHLWGQWLGGAGSDTINSIFVDNSGNIYASGYANSEFDENSLVFNGTYSGDSEAFITKFDSSGNHLWGQWLGGAGSDSVNSIFVDNSGNIYASGYAESVIVDDNLTTFNGTYSGDYESFFIKFESVS